MRTTLHLHCSHSLLSQQQVPLGFAGPCTSNYSFLHNQPWASLSKTTSQAVNFVMLAEISNPVFY